MCLLAAVCARAATPIFEAPFDGPGSSWITVRGVATPDPAAAREGRTALRVEPAGGVPDACVRSAPVSLTIGKRYELSGWVRTEDLAVRDLGPFPHRHRRRARHGFHAVRRAFRLPRRHAAVDPRSRSASSPRRAQDQSCSPPATAARFSGKAWFEGVSLDEVSCRR